MKRPAAVFGLTYYSLLLLLSGCDISAYAVGAAAAAAVFCPLLYLCLKKRRTAVLSICTTAAAAVLLACGAYTIKYTLAYLPAAKNAVSHETRVSGVVADVQKTDDGYRYTLRCDGIGAKVLAVSPSDLYAEPADRLTAAVKSIYLLGGEDRRAYYMSKGVYLGARIEGDVSVQSDVSNRFFDRAARYRAAMCRRILYAAGPENGGLLCGIVFGDTGALTQRIRNAFSAAGISHVFAVSGFHVSTWAAIVFFAMRLLRVNRRYTFLLPTVFVFLFITVTGLPPSAVRAAVMSAILFSGGSFRFRSDLLSSLGLAVAAIGLVDPFSGGSTSLLLSVSAMLGVIVFADRIYPDVQNGVFRMLGRRRSVRILMKPVSVLLLSMTIVAVMLPVMLTIFGRVSVVAPLANLAVVPLAEIAMPLGGVCTLLGFTPGIRLAGAVCGAMIRLTGRFASVFRVRADFDLTTALCVGAAACAAFLIVRYLLKKDVPRGSFLYGAFLLCFFLSVLTTVHRYGKLKVTAVGSARTEAVVEYRDVSMLICAETPSRSAVYALNDAGIFDLDLLYLASSGNVRRVTQTFAPAAVLGAGARGAAHGEGLDITFGDGTVTVRADGTTVVFLFGHADAPQDADILFASKMPTETGTAKQIVLPGGGEDSERIHYAKNGFTYLS